MREIVKDILKFRFSMNIDPQGQEISKERFENILESWPRANTYNYANATIWRSRWLGKLKDILMYHLDTGKYYQLAIS